jgi:MFS family permease
MNSPLRHVSKLPTYYTAATLARFGDEMVAFTLVLLVLDRTGRPALAGLTAGAYAFPAVLTGPVLGAWLDRTTRRRTALALNQAVLTATMICLLVAPAWLSPALAAIAGLTLPMVSGGFTSLLPSLVPAALLPRANAVEAASFGLATICAPAAAATITVSVSVEAAVAVIAVTAAASIAVIARLPVVPPSLHARSGRFVSSVTGGLVHLFRAAPLRASTVASTLALGANGVLLVALPVHVAGLGSPRAHSGYVWTALEVGGVVAALLAGRRLGRWRPERVVIGATAAFGLAVLTWPLAPDLTVLVTLAAVAGLLDGAMMPAMLTARQLYSPPELQGRVSTTAASLRLGVMALGQVLGGLLVTVGTGVVLTGVGAGLLLAAGLGLLAGGRSVQDDRAGQAARLVRVQTDGDRTRDSDPLCDHQ